MAYAGQINYNPAGILSQFKNPAEEAGRFFQNYSNQIRQDEAAKEQIKQREQAQKNADRAFSMQGLREARDAQEYAQKQATIEANAKANAYIDAARQNMLTPSQNEALLAAYNKNPKVDVKALQDKMVAEYNKNPLLQKQGIATVNIEPAIVQKEVQTINPTTGQVEMKLMNVTPDMASALHKKDVLLSGLDAQISHKDDMAQRERLASMQIAADRANTEAKIMAQMAAESMKDRPIAMFKKLQDGSVQSIEVPSSQAARYQNEKGFSLGKLSNVDGNSGILKGKALGTDLNENIGSKDTQRVKNLANILHYHGLSAAEAEALAEMSKDRTLLGTGVDFNKILDPTVQAFRAKGSNLSRADIAKLMNKAFD